MCIEGGPCGGCGRFPGAGIGAAWDTGLEIPGGSGAPGMGFAEPLEEGNVDGGGMFAGLYEGAEVCINGLG